MSVVHFVHPDDMDDVLCLHGQEGDQVWIVETEITCPRCLALLAADGLAPVELPTAAPGCVGGGGRRREVV